MIKRSIDVTQRFMHHATPVQLTIAVLGDYVIASWAGGDGPDIIAYRKDGTGTLGYR